MTVHNRNPRTRTRRIGLALTAGVAAAVLALTGCTSAQDASQADAGSDTPKANKIAFDYPWTSLAVYATMLGVMEKTAADRGFEVVTTNDQGSLDKQIANLTSLLATDVAGIVSFPMEPASVAGIVTKAKAQGVKWVTYGGTVAGEDARLDFQGEATGIEQAKGFASWAETNGISSGTVLVTVFEEDDLGRSRSEGMRKGMAEFAPGFTVVEQSAVNSEEGLRAARAEVAKDPNLVGALALNDDVTIGLAQALKEAGKTAADLVYVGGNDGSPQVLEALVAGDTVIRSTIALNVHSTGKALANVLIDLIEGGGETYLADFELVEVGSPKINAYLATFK